MTVDQLIVTLAGGAFAVFIAWFFWFAPKKRTSATLEGDAQEVTVTVKGGYTPDVIVVRAGKPVRFRFTRRESASCSEKVLFPELEKSVLLPEGEEVVLEFTPQKPGEYDFRCQMGMLRGKLIVE